MQSNLPRSSWNRTTTSAPLRPDEWINRIVYRGAGFSMGEWRCGPAHRLWSQENHILDGHNLVFPRTCVYIKPQRGEAIVSTPNQANFYNYGENYYRAVISPEGEISEYFLVEPAILREAVRGYDPASAEHPDRPFRHTHATCDSQTYLAQRMLFRHVNSGAPIDNFFVDEVFLRVLHRTVASAYAGRGARPNAPRHDTRKAHVELTDRARRYLALHFREPIQLDDVAGAVGTSKFHLCRVFRSETGLPLHRFLSRLRLRTAMECAADSKLPLTNIALEFGFASHSHFTDSFRREFGFPPGLLRCREPQSLARRLA